MANDSGNHVVDGKHDYDQRQGKRNTPPESSPAAMLIHIPRQTQSSYEPDSAQDFAPHPHRTSVTLAGHSTQIDEEDAAPGQGLSGLVAGVPLGDNVF